MTAACYNKRPMKPIAFLVAALFAAPAAAHPGAPAPLPARAVVKTAVVALARETRSSSRLPCARVDLSDPRAYLSDDTVRSKRCETAPPPSKPASPASLKK